MIEQKETRPWDAIQAVQAKEREKQMQKQWQAFLDEYSPAKLEEELNSRIIGQEELTKCVADFYYYHVMRQLHPKLPCRPMLICGPSGSGKTEVWRVLHELHKDLVDIRIADASRLSMEGWSGTYKISGLFDSKNINGGLLVFDEFDKLTKPKHNSQGDNVSMDQQSEFLKLMEGEYTLKVSPKSREEIPVKNVGIVFVGAYEWLRESKKVAAEKKIGFGTHSSAYVSEKLTTDDMLRAGIMPEIVGRIATVCETRELNEEHYFQIVNNHASRVSIIAGVLAEHGADVYSVINEKEIRALISQAREQRTGVRWVSAQIENKLLDIIRTDGIKCCPSFDSLFEVEIS